VNAHALVKRHLLKKMFYFPYITFDKKCAKTSNLFSEKISNPSTGTCYLLLGINLKLLPPNFHNATPTNAV
jgi:hypothetical protein